MDPSADGPGMRPATLHRALPADAPALPDSSDRSVVQLVQIEGIDDAFDVHRSLGSPRLVGTPDDFGRHRVTKRPRMNTTTMISIQR